MMEIKNIIEEKGYVNLTELSNDLNKHGYKTRKGCKFSPSIVRRLI